MLNYKSAEISYIEVSSKITLLIITAYILEHFAADEEKKLYFSKK